MVSNGLGGYGTIIPCVIMVRRGRWMVLLVVLRVFVGLVLVWLMVQYAFHIAEMEGIVWCTIS